MALCSLAMPIPLKDLRQLLAEMEDSVAWLTKAAHSLDALATNANTSSIFPFSRNFVWPLFISLFSREKFLKIRNHGRKWEGWN